jgi:hypothetical protein
MSTIQYTLRGIPRRLNDRLRQRARDEGKSLNTIAIEALTVGAGLSAETTVRYDDLDDLAGTWVEDPAFDLAVREMDRVDPELWK